MVFFSFNTFLITTFEPGSFTTVAPCGWLLRPLRAEAAEKHFFFYCVSDYSWLAEKHIVIIEFAFKWRRVTE